MKPGGKANKGFGRTLNYAIRNLLKDKFGKGNFETRRTHAARLKRFVIFLKASGATDFRKIERSHLIDYGSYVGELCACDELSVGYGNNLVSSANVLLELMTNGTCRRVSPSELVGRRSYVRTEEPSGLHPKEYESAIQGLIQGGNDRLAVLVGICRLTGARFREASLLPLAKARNSANCKGEIVITHGSKGGRAKQKPRHIRAPAFLVGLLNDVVGRIVDPTVIPSGNNYIQWYGEAHREWRRLSANYGMNSKFHDLRAAYACERLQVLTGEPAPCVKRPALSFEVLPIGERLTDTKARLMIAEELGHSRVGVVSAYCGSPA